MRTSDVILMVAQLDLPGLRNVVRLLQYFERHEGISEKIKVVINRLGLEETKISLTKAVETIGREIFWQLPNDYATMVESRNNGVPLITQGPKSKLTKSIQQLALGIDKNQPGRSATRGEKEQEPLPVSLPTPRRRNNFGDRGNALSRYGWWQSRRASQVLFSRIRRGGSCSAGYLA